MDQFKMCGLLINGVPLDTYEGAALLDYSVGETSIKNETFQGVNRSTWHLLKSIFGVRQIKITIVFTAPTRRMAALQRSKFNSALFGASEIFISDDGFFYDVSLENCGPEELIGEGERETKIKSNYVFKGTRRDALVSETVPGGGSVFCQSTMPFTDARLTVNVGPSSSRSFSGSLVSFQAAASDIVSALSASVDYVQSGSGDPSPNNIRPIVGYTSAKFYVSSTNASGSGIAYEVSFGSAGTVYKGTLDAKTGLLTVTWAGVDGGSLTWTKGQTTYRDFTSSQISNVDPDQASVTVGCSMYPAYSYDDSPSSGYSVFPSVVNTSGKASFYVRDRDAASTKTAEEFRQYVTGQTFLWKLATPVTYQLTPTAIQLINGTNYLSANCGDINVTVEHAPPNPYPLGGALFSGVSGGDVLVFDGIDGKITKNGANAAASVSWTEFPRLVPGENTITAPDAVTVEFYPTYL